jgi:hypothetical protein
MIFLKQINFLFFFKSYYFSAIISPPSTTRMSSSSAVSRDCHVPARAAHIHVERGGC